MFKYVTLGHDEDLIRFLRPCHNFEGHSRAKYVKFECLCKGGGGASVFFENTCKTTFICDVVIVLYM